MAGEGEGDKGKVKKIHHGATEHTEPEANFLQPKPLLPRCSLCLCGEKFLVFGGRPAFDCGLMVADCGFPATAGAARSAACAVDLASADVELGYCLVAPPPQIGLCKHGA